MDVVDLRSFYASPLGQKSAHFIADTLRPMFGPQPGQTVLGLGYALPLLEALTPENTRNLAFMLARQGVIHWPGTGSAKSALVEAYDLPLLESVVDHVIVAHGLELSDAPLEMLQEIWRVLAPQGKLYLVVPNRRGLWSTSDSSPFGWGQPFSRGQLSHLLQQAQFQAVQWQYALWIPPVQRASILKTGPVFERVGRVVATRFSGVIIVQGTKQVYAFSSGKRQRKFVPRFRTGLLPAPRPMA